ncbi:MAG: aerobic carbon-monoxide dehydrogenase large subunit, partial [Gaiellaceae bacterium]|nr:aerobic carbon-monoxide dehydrogenase large subunit [Gaiellaceae bacterium]
MTEILEPRQTEEEAATGDPIGSRMRRVEDERLVRGLGRFVDDIDPPRLAHMAVVRCPYPRARIAAIDVSAARELEGVLQVLVPDDVLGRVGPITILRPIPDAPRVMPYALAKEVALYEGQPVVSICAISRYVAEDAAGLVDVEWEPLPHVTDVLAAAGPDAPILHPELGTNILVTNPRGEGDPERGFAESDVVFEDTFTINRVSGLPMETRAILASYTPGLKQLEVWASTQAPHLFRRQLSQSLSLEEADIRVMSYDIGGAFGLKLGIFPEDLLACVHSIDLGRPVKWIEDRMEFFRGATHARESVHKGKMGASSDGKIVSYTNQYYVDAGAHNSPMGSPMLASLQFQGPYAFPHGYVERNVVLTNKVPVGAYRGYGQPEGCFVRELLLDRIARKLEIDPLDIRRRNFIRPEQMPYKTPGGSTYDSGDYQACLDMAAEQIGYDDVRARQADGRGDGRYLGVGFACYVEMTGYPGSRFLGKHNAQYGAHEGVVIRANRSGGVDVYTGVPPIGQSTETAFTQVAASVIGLDPAKVRVYAGDTTGTPVNTGSFASRTLIAGSGAIQDAGRQIREKAKRVAAYMLDVPEGDLDLVNSVFTSSADPTVSISFEDVAINTFYGHRLPEGELPGLEATAYWEPTSSAFSYGTAAAIVEVDVESGEFELQRFLFVHDCGRQVNPMLVEGQLHGGIAQALGAALFEEIVYDSESGQLVNGSMLDYFMPTAADLPRIELDHTEVLSPVTPLGVRGIGESGTIPPGAAVANAL